MSTDFDNDYNDDGLDGNDLVTQLRKQLRDKDKALKAATDELSSLRTTTRSTSLKSILEAKGVKPKIAAFIPADIEASDEAVGKWLEEYGDVFNVAPSETSQGDGSAEPAAEQTPAAPAIPKEVQEFLARVSGVEAGAVAGTSRTDQDTAKLREMAADSPDLESFIAQIDAARRAANVGQ